jgi:competence protein ComEC
MINNLRNSLILITGLLAGLTAALAAPAGSPPARAADTNGKLVVTFFDMSGGVTTPLRIRHLGLAVFIRTPSGAVYLYDTGVAFPFPSRPGTLDYDTGRDTIAPYLRARGIKVLDGVVVSHAHGDHHGGGPYLAEHFTIKSVIHPVLDLPTRLLSAGKKREPMVIDTLKRAENFLRVAIANGADDLVVGRGNKLHWDPALEIEVLSPPEEFIPSDVSVENANSLVLRIRHGKIVFLLTADARPEAQENMMKNYRPEFLRATIMSAPHHGDDSYEPFARMTRPEVVVVSCGTQNAANPTRAVEKTKAAFDPVGAKIYATPWHGTIEFVSDGNTYKVTTERSGEPPAGVVPSKPKPAAVKK